MLNRETERNIALLVMTAAILLVVGCDIIDDKQSIIIDDTDWIPIAEKSEDNDSLNRSSKTRTAETSLDGPRIDIGHLNPAEIEGEEFNINVSISPNEHTNAPVNTKSLTVIAKKSFFEKDISKLVSSWIETENCMGNDGFCERLSVDKTIELKHGRGMYKFSIVATDERGEPTTTEFTITRL